MGKERKEKVLHTRIPAVLEQELKRLAENLRVPVSNVVRTILEDAVDTADAVGGMAEDGLHNVADRLGRRRSRMREAPAERPAEAAEEVASGPPLAGIVGYQPLMLARDESCSLCGAAMTAGSQAWLGVREVAGPRVLLDERCLPFSASKTASTEQGETDD